MPVRGLRGRSPPPRRQRPPPRANRPPSRRSKRTQMSHIEPMPASGSLESSSSLQHGASKSRSMTLRHRIDWYFFRPSRPINLAICRILFFLGVLIFHLPRDLSNWASVPKNYWHPVFMFSALHLTVMSAHHL